MEAVHLVTEQTGAMQARLERVAAHLYAAPIYIMCGPHRSALFWIELMTQTPSYQDAMFETADGLHLEYRDYPALGDQDKLPVLCLHGLTRNLRDFEDLAPRIAAQGHRVITASQRGRGRSDWDPDPSHYQPAHYAQDMIGLLDRLKIDTAIFVGTSMGGLMTMVVAALAPSRIAAVVLNDIGPELDPVGIGRIQQYAGRAGEHDSWAAAAAYVREVNEHAFPDETTDAFWLDFARRTHREDPSGRIIPECDPAVGEVIRNASEPVPDLWPLFAALKPLPTLLVRGAISDLLAESTVAKMLQLKPDMAVSRVSQVGHAPFLTEQDAWQALSRFLEKTCRVR